MNIIFMQSPNNSTLIDLKTEEGERIDMKQHKTGKKYVNQTLAEK